MNKHKITFDKKGINILATKDDKEVLLNCDSINESLSLSAKKEGEGASVTLISDKIINIVVGVVDIKLNNNAVKNISITCGSSNFTLNEDNITIKSKQINMQASQINLKGQSINLG